MGINRKFIVFAGIAIIFAGLFIRYLGRAPKRHYSDFRVYYATGARFAAKEDIYARPEESITPYKYSPVFAMLLSPLHLFSEKSASLIFFTVNFISLIAVFIFSNKIIVRDKISFKQNVFLYGFSALFSLRFILHVLDSGQVSIIMFLLLLSGLYFLYKQKDPIASSLIGLSIMIKYMPAIFLPYFISKKKVKIVAYILLFVLIYCLIPALYVGIDKEADYIKNWLPFISKTSFDRGSLYDYKNQSFVSFSLRHFTRVSPYRSSLAGFTFNQGLLIAFLTGLIIYFFVVFPGPGRASGGPIDYACLFIFMLLFNPNSWMHNFVIFTFIYMALLYYLIKIKFKDRFTLVLLIISFALTSLTSELFVGDSLEKLFEEFSCITIGTLILMFLFFRLKFKKENLIPFWR